MPAHWVIKLPNGLNEIEAMSLGTAGLTAGLSIQALEKYSSTTGFEGSKSIVTGSTGGVGSIAVMLLSKLGSEVTAVTGKKYTKIFFRRSWSFGSNFKRRIIRDDKIAYG